MQANDRNRFFAVMNGMAKVYERELDPLVLDAYWVALRDWSLEEFESAAGHLMRSSEFMPRPAQFHALKQAATTKDAHSAWFTKGKSDDPLANKAMHIAAQGRYVGHIALDELPFVQRRFIAAYEDLQESEGARQALGILPYHAPAILESLK
jgi:hypothetical protein